MRNLAKITFEKACRAAYLGLAGFALVALLAMGASTSTRLNSFSDTEPQNTVELTGQAAISPDPQETEPVTRKMGDSSGPDCEPLAILTQFLALGTFSNQSYGPGKNLAIAQTLAWISYSPKDKALVSSTFIVSSSLGRQFTLVGAKPSGTG